MNAMRKKKGDFPMTEREYADKKAELFWQIFQKEITFEEYMKAIYELEQKHS